MGKARNKFILVARYVLAFAALQLAGASLGSGGSAYAQGTAQQAGVVIQFSDGSTRTFCIPFTGDYISGLDALLKTGLDVKLEAYGMGGLICKIGDDGCTYPDQPCACASYGPGGVYWSYSHFKDGAWKTAVQGASSAKLHNGDIDGWAWSSGKAPSLVPNFSSMCPAAGAAKPPATPTRAATVAPAKVPTFTSVPLATATHTPTLTARPAFTRTPVPTRRATLTTRPQSTLTPEPTQAPATETVPSPTADNGAQTPVPSATIPATATTTPAQVPPTLTPTPTATPTPLPSPTLAASAPPASGDPGSARIIAIVAGLGTAFAFFIWRVGASAASRRPKA